MQASEILKYMNIDYTDALPITEETRELSKEVSRFCRGSVRSSNGWFYTDKEYEEFRKAVLAKPLP